MSLKHPWAALMAVAMIAGCGSPKPRATQLASKPSSLSAQGDRVIVTPAEGLSGRVIRVNDALRYAVLNFPFGALPPREQKLNVYRRGLKVGEIMVTGPQTDDNIVGDIVTGEVKTGDTLRND